MRAAGKGARPGRPFAALAPRGQVLAGALPLLPILTAYLVLALGYALGTPRWNNPDEPAHFNYAAHLARTGQLPVLQPGDWDSQALGERLSSGRFTTPDAVDAFRYEGHQPPLYYLLLAPLYRLTEGLGANARVVALRLPSILFGGLVVLTVYAAARTLLPRRVDVATLAAGIVAFIPMHTAMTASINNDTLATLLASATLLVVLRGLRGGFGYRGALLVGLLCGGLLLTKLTVYVFVPLALLALALNGAGPTRPRNLPRATAYVTLALGLAGLLSAWWFFRNLAAYGLPDLFGLQRHDLVVVGQPRWPGLGEHFESPRFFVYSLFRSFWAQFGWMAVVLDARFYWLFLALSIVGLGGLRRFWRAELPDWSPVAHLGLRFLVAGLVLVVLEVAVYNLSFIQAQGRYLYPALLPIGILLALGWSHVARLTPGAGRWHRLLFGLGVYVILAALLEAGSWLLTETPAPLALHAASLAAVALAARVRVRRSPETLARTAATTLVASLALINLTALLRFVTPYFKGW